MSQSIQSGGIQKVSRLNQTVSPDFNGELTAYEESAESSVITSGTTSTGITLSSGSMVISSGGAVNSAVISDGGEMVISSGGSASALTVNPGGEVHVSRGGSAEAITENGGYVYVASGASATFIANAFSGLNLSGRSASLHSGTTATETIINDQGAMYISSGGTANSAVIYTGGRLYVSSSGSATAVCVNSGGSLYASKGGTVKGITENGGYVYVASGANVEFLENTFTGLNLKEGLATVHENTIASDTILNSKGSMYIYSGGAADKITVNAQGHLKVNSGGTAIAIKENGGYVNVADGANVTFIANNLNGLSLSFESATLHSGTTAANTSINNRGSMYIYSGGSAKQTTVNTSGNMYVYGNANYTSVYSKGKVYAAGGGSMYGVNLYSDGTLYISSGGTVNTLFYNGAASATVSSGGKLTGTTVNSSGTLTIRSGAEATNVTLKNGGTLKYSGGTCYNVVLLYGGIMTIENKAVRSSQIASGGTILVSKGGTASGCITKNGGTLNVLSGGSADDTQLMTNGSMHILSGGKATDTVTSFGARVLVSGGEIYNTNMKRGTVTSVFQGGTASSNTVDYGSYLILDSGASVSETFVSAGGGLTVMSGATADTNEIYGTLNCNNGGILLGETTIHSRANLAGNAVVTSECAITFDLTERAASAMKESYREAMLNNFYVAREADMTISVAADQENGSYILANWAGEANKKSYTLTVDGTEVGTFSTTESLTYNGKNYSLYCFDDATNSKALTLKICDASVTESWTDLGTGDLNGDGMEESLLSDGSNLSVSGETSLWPGSLSASEEIAGIADYCHDGTGDLPVHNAASDQMTAWLIKDASLSGTLAIA